MDENLLKCLEATMVADVLDNDPSNRTELLVKVFGISLEDPDIEVVVKRVLPKMIVEAMEANTEQAYKNLYNIWQSLCFDPDLLEVELEKRVNEMMDKRSWIPTRACLLEAWGLISFKKETHERMAQVLEVKAKKWGLFENYTWEIGYFLRFVPVPSLSRLVVMKLIASSLIVQIKSWSGVTGGLGLKEAVEYPEISLEEAKIIGKMVADHFLLWNTVKAVQTFQYVDLWNGKRFHLMEYLGTPEAREMAARGIMGELSTGDVGETQIMERLLHLTLEDYKKTDPRQMVRNMIRVRDLDRDCELAFRRILDLADCKNNAGSLIDSRVVIRRLLISPYGGVSAADVCQFLLNVGVAPIRVQGMAERALLGALASGLPSVKGLFECRDLMGDGYLKSKSILEAAKIGQNRALVKGDAETAIFIKQHFLL